MIISRIKADLPAPAKKRAAAYARVSVSSGAQLHSLSAQISHYTRMISERPDWSFAGVYADEGISGTGTQHREEFRRLMNDCAEGRIDVVITKSVSRFARNTVDLLENVRRLRAIGVEVLFERENISTADPAGEFMLAVLASVAQEESRSISENVRWGIRRGFERGRLNSFVLYGYRAEGGRLVPVPEEAEVVRLIFRNFLAGCTAGYTERQLAEMGVRSYYGGRFSQAAVRAVLRQEKYTGAATLQIYYIEDHITHKKRRNNGVLPQYHVSGSHPAIISREDFDKVQAEIARRRELGIFASGAVATNCFTSRIKCARCGRNYRRYGKYARSGECLYRYWACSTRKTKGAELCGSESIEEERLFRACSAVIGKEASPEDIMALISGITVSSAGQLCFSLSDGSADIVDWRRF